MAHDFTEFVGKLNEDETKELLVAVLGAATDQDVIDALSDRCSSSLKEGIIDKLQDDLDNEDDPEDEEEDDDDYDEDDE